MRIVSHVVFKTLCVGLISACIALALDLPLQSRHRLCGCGVKSDQGLVP